MLLDNIRLIIWDLDNTLLEGSFEEKTAELSDRKKSIIKSLTARGIVNSICSYNNCDDVTCFLIENCIFDFFVFPSIGYTPKGLRIKEICEQSHLLQEHVLFVDDEPCNREDAKFYNPKIMVLPPEDAFFEVEMYIGRKPIIDPNYEKLKQYKILEKKTKQKSFMTNTDFLIQSNITVGFDYNCKKNFDRIIELIRKTNQLNFTKKRIDKNTLRILLDDKELVCACVSVSDIYGDYGVVGFFAIRNNQFEHFLFSCRIIGMGVERYVLDMFENVSLTIIEPVAYNPYKLQPSTWINQSEKRTKHSNFFLPKKILMKGPCDIRSIVSYLSFNCYFDYEFTYINNEGISIEQINHTDHIYQSSFIDDETKMELATLPFGDIKMYSNRIFSGTYDVICLSIITDANLGRYRRKKDGVIVAFGEHCYPLTDKSNWSGYVDGSIFSANCKFDVGFLESFAQEYEFIGRISVTDFIKNLKAIIELIPFSTEIVIISGVEKKYQDYTSPNYINRYLFHREMRIEIEKLISNYRNVKLINVNDFVFNQEDFAGHYNHFQPRVYHDIAFYLSSIIDCISPTIGMED